MKHAAHKLALATIAVLSLGSCGGSSVHSEADYRLAVDAAIAKGNEAWTLAVESPCSTAQQCGALYYVDPVQCRIGVYKAYSLMSTTAQTARDAMTKQNELAAYAISIKPADLGSQCAYPATGTTGSAVPNAPTPPVLACVSNTCQIVP
jgi:hypothetical protein